MAVAVGPGAVGSDIRHLNRADQLKHLRRQMATVSGKVGISNRGAQVPDEHGPRGSDEVLPPSGALLPIPKLLAEAMPAGMQRGTVAVLSGARSLPVGMAAAVSAAGGYVAIVGLPGFGLLAAVEMGADLSRLAMIPDPGTDPLEVAAVLMDGMDLVVLDLAGRSVSAGRARALVARARHRGCTLLVVRGEWQDASLRIEAKVCGYEMAVGSGGIPLPGYGRLRRVRLTVCARGRVIGRSGARLGDRVG